MNRDALLLAVLATVGFITSWVFGFGIGYLKGQADKLRDIEEFHNDDYK